VFPQDRRFHPNRTAAERHLARLVPVPHGGALRVVLAPRADDIDHLFLHQLGQHPEPDADAQRQQPLLRRADQLPERLLHAGRQRQLLVSDLLQRYGLHGGSSCLERRLRHSPRSRRDRTRREDRHLKFYELRDNLLFCLVRHCMRQRAVIDAWPR
jgi:hypothetical protein